MKIKVAAMFFFAFVCPLTEQKCTLDSDITVTPLSRRSHWPGHKTKAELSLKPVYPSPVMQRNYRGGHLTLHFG